MPPVTVEASDCHLGRCGLAGVFDDREKLPHICPRLGHSREERAAFPQFDMNPIRLVPGYLEGMIRSVGVEINPPRRIAVIIAKDQVERAHGTSPLCREQALPGSRHHIDRLTVTPRTAVNAETTKSRSGWTAAVGVNRTDYFVPRPDLYQDPKRTRGIGRSSAI
jgi:hypothetical protein